MASEILCTQMGGATSWKNPIPDTIQPPSGPLGHCQPSGLYLEPWSQPHGEDDMTSASPSSLTERHFKKVAARCRVEPVSRAAVAVGCSQEDDYHQNLPTKIYDPGILLTNDSLPFLERTLLLP